MEMQKKASGRWRHLLAVATLPLMLTFAQPLQAATQLTPFELDANAVDDAGNGDDWSTPPTPNPPGHAIKFTDILPDPSPQTIFKGGGSKDEKEISLWRWANEALAPEAGGGSPDKNELTHAYAAAYRDTNDDLLIYFGADRFDNSGDANMGFWFFQDPITPTTSGNTNIFSGGAHQNGDTLVIISFPSSAAPYMSVLVWDDTCSKGVKNPQPVTLPGNPNGQCAGTNLRLKVQGLGSNATANSVCAGVGLTNLACAITNNETVTVPGLPVLGGGGSLWSDYRAKGVSTAGFPSKTFFEGGINLSQILGPNNATCVSSFLAETRSSTSLDAVLKDFVMGSFELCGIEITGHCEFDGEAAPGSTIPYKITGQVTNTGIGPVYDAEVTQVPDNDANTPEPIFDPTLPFSVVSPLLAGPLNAADYDVHFTSTINSPSVVLRVGAASSSGGVESTSGTVTVSDCPTLREPLLSVTKACSTVVEEVEGKGVVVRVDYSGNVCNNSQGKAECETACQTACTNDPSKCGSVQETCESACADLGIAVTLTNVVVTDNKDSAPIDDIADLGPMECQPYSGSYYPSSMLVVSGATPVVSGANPTDVHFTDTVTATADAPFGLANPTTMAVEADCPLCE